MIGLSSWSTEAKDSMKSGDALLCRRAAWSELGSNKVPRLRRVFLLRRQGKILRLLGSMAVPSSSLGHELRVEYLFGGVLHRIRRRIAKYTDCDQFRGVWSGLGERLGEGLSIFLRTNHR